MLTRHTQCLSAARWPLSRAMSPQSLAGYILPYPDMSVCVGGGGGDLPGGTLQTGLTGWGGYSLARPVIVVTIMKTGARDI